MRVRIIWTGKTRDARIKALIDEYLERISHFARCEIVELRESSANEGLAGIDKDSKRISDRLPSGTTAVLLDPLGTEWNSQELAAEVRRWENAGAKEVAFIVGGPRGVSLKLSQQLEKRWSLSRLTLTHEMARLILVEQLYRAYTILRGLPYQK